ncbi:MAG TPA: hypothetical protein VGX28_04040 [Frankiaceae bacterium]|nr:hypothetical protein [Frankiaceae bacterium]
MRLLLAILACLALCPASASAATGEVVVVANGPGAAVVTLPSDVALDLSGVTFETASPYVVLSAQRDRVVRAWLVRFRDGGTFGSASALAAGRVAIRVWTAGRTTVRIPAPGLGQRLTVEATAPVPATAVTRTVAPDVTGTAASDVAFANPTGRAFVLQTVDRAYVASAARAGTLCVAPGSDPCGETAADPRPLLDGNVAWQVQPGLWFGGPGHAYYRATEVAAGGGAVRHDVVVLPLE